jgi:triacylglycerol esterase/lipase EstA (alpha/beta hydrolase family)
MSMLMIVAHDGRVLSSLPPARRRLVLALAALVVAAAVAVGVVLATRGGAPAPVAQDRPGPVFIVPGYGGSTAGPEALAAALRRDGKDVTVVPLPDNGYGDFDDQAAVLDRAVAAKGAASVDVIGYSDGGIVVRTWVKDKGGAGKARRVVTLSSPHHGTDLAGLGGSLGGDACPTACQEVLPGSAFLNRLNAGDETPAGPQWVSIWTTNDQVVTPPASARLDGALDLVVQDFCPADPVDHGGMPADPVVQQIVAQELTAGAVQRPSVTCARPSS